MKVSTCRLLWLPIIYIALQNVYAEQSSLLTLAQQLHCAKTEQDASKSLSKLSSLPIQPFGIPSDNFDHHEKFLLYAASVDILLKVIYDTIQRYPQLQEPAERTVLLWNYCEIMSDDGIVDLAIDQSGKTIKQQPTDFFPEKKQGFSIWGFLKPDPNNRYLPKIVEETSVWPLFHQNLVFRLYQQQCFPHPDTGALVNEPNDNQPPPFGSLGIKEELALNKRYPYLWQSDCTESQTPPPSKPADAITPKPEAKPEQKQLVKITTKLKPSPKFKQNNLIARQHTVIFNPKPIAMLKTKVQTDTKTKKTEKTEPTPSVGQKILNTISRKYTAPKDSDKPRISPAIPSEKSNTGAPLPLPPDDGLGIAGNFYNRSKLTGGQSFGANLSWHPISSFFIRGGVNYGYYPGKGNLSYSWGIGYDDWHPGTFSVQLNNWGPIRFNEGIALKQAVASVGYKFEADFLKPYDITGSAAVSIPLTGDPSISTTWNWSPVENWFIRASLQRKFGSRGEWNWGYNFGYSDWHPFTFSVTYDNWGSNTLWDGRQQDVFNFRKNGAVSIGWSWAF